MNFFKKLRMRIFPYVYAENVMRKIMLLPEEHRIDTGELLFDWFNHMSDESERANNFDYAGVTQNNELKRRVVVPLSVAIKEKDDRRIPEILRKLKKRAFQTNNSAEIKLVNCVLMILDFRTQKIFGYLKLIEKINLTEVDCTKNLVANHNKWVHDNYQKLAKATEDIKKEVAIDFANFIAESKQPYNSAKI